MIDELLISALPGDVRAAARGRGRLLRLAADRGTNGPAAAGDRYLGRITTLAPAIGGAFVDLGEARAGLLMAGDGPPGRALAEGGTLVVDVLRAAEGSKGAKLTARLAVDDADAAAALCAAPIPRRLVRGPSPVEILVQQADAAGNLTRVVVDDGPTLARLRTVFPQLTDRLQPWSGAAPLFETEDVEMAIEAALRPEVPLPGGGRMVIEETEALVAIDVDSGAAQAASASAAALAVNLQAAAAIGREIRLRELAGRIVIDFLPLRRPAERSRLLASLHQALAGDDRPLRVGGWTRLGFVELRRDRRGPSLARQLLIPCSTCTGRGRVLAPDWVAGTALRALAAQTRRDPRCRPVLVAAPAVIAAMTGPVAAAAEAVSARLGSPLALHADPTLSADAYHLIPPADVSLVDPGR